MLVVCDEDDVFVEIEFGECCWCFDGGVVEYCEVILVVREVVFRFFVVKFGVGFILNFG